MQKIKVGDLRKNFDKMMTNSSETCIKIIDKVLENSELNNYFNQNPEARKKLNQQMEEKIFLETTQNAVMHLKLDRRTLEALGTMPEFRKAVTNAIQAKKETRETIEELIDEDLGSKGGIRKLWEKMPLGGGIGAILMLLTMLGLVVGGKKFVGSK